MSSPPSPPVQQPLADLLQRALQHHQQGQLDAAQALYLQMLQAAPRHADALHLLGVVALQRGQFDTAVEHMAAAIAIRPADNFLCNLGNALKALGRLDEAVAAYRQALALNPQMAQALSNLGDALLALGDAEAAADSCRRAIALMPDSAEAHANLGLALWRQGRLDEAAAALQQALRIQPGLALLHSHLGRVQQQRGQLDAAIACQLQALQISGHPAFRASFVQTIRQAHFQAPHAAVRAQLIRALQEGGADTADLLTPATSLVEAEPTTQRALACMAAQQPIPQGLLKELAADHLLMALLQADALNSIELERLLTQMRRQLLQSVDDAAPAAIDALCAALAVQCFINEYVYACSDGELQLLEALRVKLDACAADGRPPTARCLTAWASYAPLHELAGAAGWAAVRWPQPLAALFTQQVHEPAVEARLRSTVPQLTSIVDTTSQRVQAQYEAHPYPRWTRLPPAAAPCDIDTLLRRQFPAAPLQPRGRSGALDVLVAGCGTGQHPIRVAQQFIDAQVLAVDLSLASLAYAQRKTDELGITRIRYAQADILQLGHITQRFDLIESAGVLHHMQDLLAGWRVLCGLLRPGGLMFIGLYSELGRRDVVAARQRLAGAVLPEQAVDIRACRQQLMQAPQSGHFLSSRDFFSTSACRDLLFHVQEQRCTLPQLQVVLAQLGLHFIGFELDADVLADYSRHFPDDAAGVDLDHWHAYELARPETFSRMYNFWVQKAD